MWVVEMIVRPPCGEEVLESEAVPSAEGGASDDARWHPSATPRRARGGQTGRGGGQAAPPRNS